MVYVGVGINLGKVEEIFATIMQSGEILLSANFFEATTGVFNTKKGIDRPLLLVTNQRVVSFKKGRRRQNDVKWFSMTEIRNVIVHKHRRMQNKLILHLSLHRIQNFEYMTDKTAHTVAGFIRQYMAGYQAAEALSENQSSAEILNPVQTLDQRYAAGEIDRNTYLRMKSDILRLDPKRKNPEICPSCNGKIDTRDLFCSNCGMNIQT